LSDVWTFNLSSSVWDNIYSNMETERRSPSCVFVPDAKVIYVVAGHDLRTVEKLNIDDPISWTLLDGTLENGGGRDTRSVYYERTVYIVGGNYYDNVGGNYYDVFVDAVYSIDTQTDAVSLRPEMTLPFGIYGTACSVVSGDLWCVGGQDSNRALKDNIWSFSNLPTASPTSAPSQSATTPSNAPTASPSNQSQGPTFMPSSNPTSDPTSEPTTDPSAEPTADPTIDPTEEPTYGPTEDPSTNPTRDPTSDPTLEPATADLTIDPTTTPSANPNFSPLYPTADPTVDPTSRLTFDPIMHSTAENPTTVPSEYSSTPQSPIQDTEFQSSTTGAIIASAGGAMLILFGIAMYSLRKARKIKKQLTKNDMPISNPMVVSLALQSYDEDVVNPEFTNGYVEDLDGVKHDILNLTHLFHDCLRYECYPVFDEYPKLRWSKHDLVNFINVSAEIFAANLYDPVTNKQGFDGLFFSISSHGVNQSILTSDYGLVKKKDIYRAFTDKYPAARLLPRMFLFDCCDGAKSMAKTIKTRPKKKVEYAKIDDDENDGEEWIAGDENPDWKLAILNSSNLDYQSWLSNDVGSYMIHWFYKRAMERLESGKAVYLGEIFDEIQADLGKTHQLPTFTFNNGTRWVKLEKNKVGLDEAKMKTNEEMIEMILYHRQVSMEVVDDEDEDDQKMEYLPSTVGADIDDDDVAVEMKEDEI